MGELNLIELKPHHVSKTTFQVFYEVVYICAKVPVQILKKKGADKEPVKNDPQGKKEVFLLTHGTF